MKPVSPPTNMLVLNSTDNIWSTTSLPVRITDTQRTHCSLLMYSIFVRSSTRYAKRPFLLESAKSPILLQSLKDIRKNYLSSSFHPLPILPPSLPGFQEQWHGPITVLLRISLRVWIALWVPSVCNVYWRIPGTRYFPTKSNFIVFLTDIGNIYYTLYVYLAV